MFVCKLRVRGRFASAPRTDLPYRHGSGSPRGADSRLLAALRASPLASPRLQFAPGDVSAESFGRPVAFRAANATKRVDHSALRAPFSNARVQPASLRRA
ncbi:MAG: hypothetical protein IT518_18950 [Burkholderiales bacterium]|nr:hypothetical protein [Burkholderiales bacterium]